MNAGYPKPPYGSVLQFNGRWQDIPAGFGVKFVKIQDKDDPCLQ
jgi:hypothetical protein